ncbi:gamma-tubulin complex component 2 [Citrus sinensis]|uniref:Gamma-tubulin complex component 2 n=1 Tax=Citrus sinensis TaxID=2711 RepID=A0ACB8IMA3_CITSI|nr:gamma-tubulin complex component 2 [Citrus sinensis]
MEMSYPSTPRWNIERPFLTGRFHQETKAASRFADSFSNNGAEMAIGCYDAGVQELLVIDDLLSALVGIEGRYISIKRRVNHVHGNDTYDSTVTFQVDASMDLALQFVESRSQFKNGLVNHAFAASLRALLLDYEAMVAQLEHQFRLGRLSIQGLWFYCQPMLGSMQAVSAVIHKASANNFTGSAVLNLLQSQAKAMAGDNTVRSLLEKMTQCASNAYLGILERWVYEGVIDDPYGEFFIAEDKSLLKESLTQDYDAKYWRQRYSLKDGIPSFLANIAGKILTTGKYLNVMRECGHSAQGDFLVHFMDIAREELMKQLDEITVEKLQSLLDIALRSTAAAADPCHEDLTCSVERSSLLKRMATLKGVEIKTSSDSVDLEQPVSITGLETFSLSYKVQWPLSIVISRKALTKYQMVFRLLFHCKHVERQLCGAWQVHQVIQHHDFFLDKCLRECLLHLPDLLKKVERLKSLCLQYAAATQWLISSSTDLPKLEEPSDGFSGSEKFKQLKLRSLSQVQKVMIRDATVTESILKFEREFNNELQSLGPILSSSSQAEPYLTHLAQLVLGVGFDK